LIVGCPNSLSVSDNIGIIPGDDEVQMDFPELGWSTENVYNFINPTTVIVDT